MTRQDIIDAVVSVVEEMRAEYVPNPETRYKKGGSTGTMAFDALRYDIYDDMVDIYVDPKIAPYVPYTNEPWLSDRWNGKPNPNEGWWQRFADEFAKRLATKLRGELR